MRFPSINDVAVRSCALFLPAKSAASRRKSTGTNRGAGNFLGKKFVGLIDFPFGILVLHRKTDILDESTNLAAYLRSVPSRINERVKLSHGI
jgi:hypothetical protein